MADKQVYSFSMCRLIATLGVVFLVYYCLAMGGHNGFFNIPAMLITVGIAFFLLLGTFGTDFLKFIPGAFTCLVCTPLKPNPRYADIAKFGSRYVVGAAVIGTLMGAIQMLRNLDDPSSIGIGMAVALLPSFYALVVSEVFFAYVYKSFLDGHVANGSLPLPFKNAMLPIAIAGLIFYTFLIMIVAFTNLRTNEPIDFMKGTGYIKENITRE